MPTYTFREKENPETVFEQFFKTISQKEEFLLNNPHLEQIHTSAASIGDTIRLGLRKPDDAFRDKLKDIKRKHYGSTVNTFWRTV